MTTQPEPRCVTTSTRPVPAGSRAGKKQMQKYTKEMVFPMDNAHTLICRCWSGMLHLIECADGDWNDTLFSLCLALSFSASAGKYFP